MSDQFTIDPKAFGVDEPDARLPEQTKPQASPEPASWARRRRITLLVLFGLMVLGAILQKFEKPLPMADALR